VLIVPLGFRMTCYYYRKAYYRAFWQSPPACAVAEPHGSYSGETRFPLIFQNAHRYFFYVAALFILLLSYDAIQSYFFTTDRGTRFGIGIGSLVLLASNSLLTLYTFSCHSIRHLAGGRVDCFSCVVAGGPRQDVWKASSWLNGHHMAWAWWSLFFVCFADLYVRLCASGVWHDVRLL